MRLLDDTKSVAPYYSGVSYKFIKELNYNDVCLIPNRSIAKSRSDCDTSVGLGAQRFLMPVYPSNMKSVVNEETCKYLAKRGWFYTMHRFGVDSCEFIKQMHDLGLMASVSVGIKKINIEALVNADYITLDIANAWSESVKHVVEQIKEKVPSAFLIVGNVATSEAVTELQSWGADAIKVGIAGGHVCITKDKTGFHRPMISTILDCVSVAKVPIIADGGIESSGDVAKALACGASMVMAGMLFSGYDESAGDLLDINGKQCKEYYGSASEFNKIERRNIEGCKVLVGYKGPMSKLLTELKENLQSSISYAGGKNLSALSNTRIIEI